MHNYSNPPPEEIARLNALRKLKILDSPYESLFDTITSAASELCRTPIALISFVDEDCQWFKSKIGIDGVSETPRELAFCTHTILSKEILEVTDTHLDERFKNNPLVLGSPNIRFYAGASISLPLGERVGTLCVIDTLPNQLNEFQKVGLEGLARVISQALIIREYNLKAKHGKSSMKIYEGIKPL